jgi:predicted deacylase
LIELLASNYGKDTYLTNLLDTREIIITPMTNPYGFYKRERGELVNGKLYDINRDFPYNSKPSDCMNTIAGRVIYKLFQDNLFVSTITFHGGTTVISYCWGSQNHLTPQGNAAEAPDHVAFDLLGHSMLEAAGGDI